MIPKKDQHHIPATFPDALNQLPQHGIAILHMLIPCSSTTWLPQSSLLPGAMIFDSDAIGQKTIVFLKIAQQLRRQSTITYVRPDSVRIGKTFPTNNVRKPPQRQ